MPIWGYLGSDQTPILPSSAQSVVLNYSCYCGVRIELACLFPGNTTCLEEWGQSGNVANLEIRLQTWLQTSLGREAKSLMGYPLSFPCGRRPLKQTNKHIPNSSSQMKSKCAGLFFQKSTRGRWACSKMHRIKKRTPLWKTNFLIYTTLLLSPKRYVHSKGPKIGLCLC